MATYIENELFEDEQENVRVEQNEKAEASRTVTAFRDRVRKTHGKAGFIGVVYFLLTIILAGVSFLPIYALGEQALSVANMFDVLMNISKLGGNLLPLLLPPVVLAILYFLMLLSVVINVFKSMACLKKLFKKRPSRQNGYNRNAQAMEKMGRIFSGSLFAFFGFGLWAQVLFGVEFTLLAVGVVAVGVFFHILLGVSGGTISYFRVGKFIEEKRLGGSFAPFVRNIVQIAAVLALFYFFNKFQTVPTLWALLVKGAFSALASETMALVLFVVLPAVEFLIFLFLYFALHHAIYPGEFHHDGKHAPHRASFRKNIFMVFLLTTGIEVLALTYFKAPFEFNDICIAVCIALGVWILELLTRKLPRDKKASDVMIEYVDPVEQRTNYVPAPTSYVQNPQPAIIYQVPAPQQNPARESKAQELAEKWMRMAECPPQLDDEEEKGEEPVETRTVTCPVCGDKITLEIGDTAQRCPSCNVLLRARKK